MGTLFTIISAIIIGLVDLFLAAFCLEYHSGILWFMLYVVVVTIIALILGFAGMMTLAAIHGIAFLLSVFIVKGAT